MPLININETANTAELELSNKDRITQLQDALEGLSLQMITGLDYLQRHASFQQTNPGLPITRENSEAVPTTEFEQTLRQKASEIRTKVHEIQQLGQQVSLCYTLDREKEVISSSL